MDTVPLVDGVDGIHQLASFGTVLDGIEQMADLVFVTRDFTEDDSAFLVPDALFVQRFGWRLPFR